MLFINCLPNDVSGSTDVNHLLHQIYWDYLDLRAMPLFILERYGSFRWLRTNRRYRRYGRISIRKSQFLKWEIVLKKMVWLSKKDAAFEAVSDEEFRLLFHYFHQLIAENIPLRLKGVTIRSLIRRTLEWQKEIRDTASGRWSSYNIWIGAAYQTFEKEQDGILYQIIQLNTGEELQLESAQMRHCVFTYKGKCMTGRCSIWSLRKKENDSIYPLATIEVDQKHQIVQVKTRMNGQPGRKYLKLIDEWAEREKLKRGSSVRSTQAEM